MKRLSFLQSLAMLGLFLGLQNMLSSVLLLPSILIHRKLGLNLTVLALANAAAFVGAVSLGSLIFRVPWRALLSFGDVPWRVAPAVGIMALGSFVLCSEVDNITRMFLPVPKVLGEMFEQLMDVTRHPIGAALALAVVAPLSEELLCRKWVLGSLLARWKPWRAIGLSAVIFGAMHLNPWQFIYATLLGLAFGWIFWRTGAVWLCILAHGINNSLVWCFGFFPPNLPGMTGSHNSAPEFQPLWLDAGALAVFVAGACWLRRQTAPPAWKDPILEQTSLPTQLPPVLPPPLPPGA
ncbi:MAG TPA: type II CAAX endopeptidase family protein [Verrucomicrobiae bacterium]|nr:type II CAAX endopeptidase family protein [Verrucomicrobiae bacterium]